MKLLPPYISGRGLIQRPFVDERGTVVHDGTDAAHRERVRRNLAEMAAAGDEVAAAAVLRMEDHDRRIFASRNRPAPWTPDGE